MSARRAAREFWLIEWGKLRYDGTRFICTARTAEKAREFIKSIRYLKRPVETIHVREVRARKGGRRA